MQVALPDYSHNGRQASTPYDMHKFRFASGDSDWRVNHSAIQVGKQGKNSNWRFFSDLIQKVDVVVMGNILHDWAEDQKILLMKKVYDPRGFICEFRR